MDFDELIKSYKSLKVDNEDSLEVRAGTVDDSKVVKSYKVL